MNNLNHRIVACRRCPRLVAFREAVAQEKKASFRDWVYWGKPVPSTGDAHARLLLVGLAPGAHGSNRTGRMFTGDASGDFLTPALYRAGFATQPTSIRRDDGLRLVNACIVAVAHCAPPDNKPTSAEIARCRPYLVAHLRLLRDVRVILALGRVAFDGLLAALEESGDSIPRPRPSFAHGAEFPLGRTILLASYHPSRQNTQTGRLTAKMFDAVLARARELLAG